MKEQKKNNANGITLVALVITIIVLLILAGVSISLIAGENGILSKAVGSVEANNEGVAKEQVSIAWSSVQAEYMADKVTKGAEAKDYFTLEKLNENITQGEITKVSYIVDDNGTSELVYKFNGLFYKIIISRGSANVDGEPNTTEPKIKDAI